MVFFSLSLPLPALPMTLEAPAPAQCKFDPTKSCNYTATAVDSLVRVAKASLRPVDQQALSALVARGAQIKQAMGAPAGSEEPANSTSSLITDAICSACRKAAAVAGFTCITQDVDGHLRSTSPTSL